MRLNLALYGSAAVPLQKSASGSGSFSSEKLHVVLRKFLEEGVRFLGEREKGRGGSKGRVCTVDCSGVYSGLFRRVQ
jgi:hypothetical protein